MLGIQHLKSRQNFLARIHAQWSPRNFSHAWLYLLVMHSAAASMHAGKAKHGHEFLDGNPHTDTSIRIAGSHELGTDCAERKHGRELPSQDKTLLRIGSWRTIGFCRRGAPIVLSTS